MRKLSEADADETVDVDVGETIEIALPENPTTGHRWQVDAIDPSLCAIVADERHAPQRPQPGAGGTHVWRLKALRAGRCHIALAYRRAWETAEPAARNFKLTLRAKA